MFKALEFAMIRKPDLSKKMNIKLFKARLKTKDPKGKMQKRQKRSIFMTNE